VDPVNSASISTELAKQGPLGIFCLCLIGAIIILWRTIVADRAAAAAALKAEREASAAALKEANAQIIALQESRLQYAQKTAEMLTNAAGVMSNQTGALRDLEDSLRAMLADAQARRGQR
jgi:hypothetical protein